MTYFFYIYRICSISYLGLYTFNFKWHTCRKW